MSVPTYEFMTRQAAAAGFIFPVFELCELWDGLEWCGISLMGFWAERRMRRLF